MKKVDFILNKCDEYESLVSTAAGEFMGPHSPVPSFHPIIEPAYKPTFVAPEFKYSPEKMHTVQLEPSRPKVKVPEESAKAKPKGFWGGVEKGFEAGKKEKLLAKENLAKSIENLGSSIGMKLYKMFNPSLKFKIQASIVVIGAVTLLSKVFANKKPSSSNKQIDDIATESFNEINSFPDLPESNGPNLLTEINSLSSQLNSLKPRTMRGEKLLKDSVNSLNDVNKSLTSLQAVPDVGNASSTQEYANLATSFAKNGGEAILKLDILIKALTASNKSDLANQASKVSSDIKKLSATVHSVKSVNPSKVGEI